MDRVLSGMQPSGKMTLGNYLGAVKIWADEDQHEYDAFFCVVDLHALTVPQVPEELRANTIELAKMYVACGLDPEKCTIFVQSHVPEHIKLSWLMECTVSIGHLQRMHQFKDKSAKGGVESARASLFTYPALMAADILLYEPTRVPVGDDQKQHVELTRDLAQKFNFNYGETFIVPEPAIPKVGARVMDLQDPTNKMSKSTESEAGCVFLLDEPSVIEKKFKRAVTDTLGEVNYDREKQPGLANLLDIFSGVTGEKPEELANRYSQYGPLKSDVAEAVISATQPIRDRYAEISAEQGEIQRILKVGAEKARAIAKPVYERAAQNIGLLLPEDSK